MFNVRLAGGHLYGKQLCTWLSLVVSLMASFVLSFFSLDVLDEIWDLIESVFEGFLTYTFMVSLSDDNQSEVIKAFNSTSLYLDDLLNIYNYFFDYMVNRIYPSELQSNL